MVVRAIYDTLTVPNDKGEYVPYLAKSITPNDDYTQWDIKVRDGVKFHDGTALDRRGREEQHRRLPRRLPGPEAAAVHVRAPGHQGHEGRRRRRPSGSRPSARGSRSRRSSTPAPASGIVAQAQLDDTKTCDRKLIGTGPFKFDSWKPNQSLKGTANPDYWQKAPDGKPYPYVDSIEFRPIPDTQVRNSSIKSGDVNVIHTSDAESIGGTLNDAENAGDLNMYVSRGTGRGLVRAAELVHRPVRRSPHAQGHGHRRRPRGHQLDRQRRPPDGRQRPLRPRQRRLPEGHRVPEVRQGRGDQAGQGVRGRGQGPELHAQLHERPDGRADRRARPGAGQADRRRT